MISNLASTAAEATRFILSATETRGENRRVEQIFT